MTQVENYSCLVTVYLQGILHPARLRAQDLTQSFQRVIF